MRTHALFSSSLRFSRALLFVGLILFSVASARAVGSEIIVRTDTLPDDPADGHLYDINHSITQLHAGGGLGVQLTSPVDGTIVGVQILWGSVNGGAPPAHETAIHISSLPVGDPYHPVATLATIDSPILTDGGTNEFRYLDPATNLVPLSLPVTAGTFYFVDLELGEDIGEGPDAATILMSRMPPAYPNSGRNPDSNQWIGAFTLGFGRDGRGNLAIRLIVQPVPEPSTYALATIGAVALLAARRRKALS